MKLYSIALLLLFFINNSIAQTIIYVDTNATGTNNGSSWTNAYTNLQSALATASSGDQLWVATGVYKATSDTGSASRNISFHLKGGISLYGGFSGNETSISQRNWVTNVTILSGDIGIQGDGLDNTKTILVFKNASDSSILDGFTIEAAYNDNNYDNTSKGGGMYLLRANLFVNHCSFLNNSCNYQTGVPCAGIYSDTSGILTIKNTVFSNNSAPWSACIYLQFICSLTIDSTKFLYNFSQYGNAAIIGMNDSCSMILSNSQFNNNTVPADGIIVGYGNNYATITNCSFDSNSINVATVINLGSNNSTSPVTIENCSFTNNIGWNGAVAVSVACSTLIYNCLFENNSLITAVDCGINTIIKKSQFISNLSGIGGGNAIVDSCSFSNNGSATLLSGGAISISFSQLTVANSSFYNNFAEDGGAININNGDGLIENCIFSGNYTTGVYDGNGNGGAIEVYDGNITF